MKLWLRGAKQIVQVVGHGESYLTGDGMKKLAILESDQGLSIIVNE